MENYGQKIKENKNLLLLAGIVILILIAISTINLFKTNTTNTTNTNTTADTTTSNTTATKEVSEISIGVRNKSDLTDTLGSTITQELLEDLQRLVPSNTSVTSIPSLDTVGKIYPPYSTRTLSVETSNSRKYDINIINKKNTCYGILIKQVSPTTSEHPHLYITNNTRDTSKYNSMISDIVNWAKKLYPDGIIVDTKYY